MTIAIYEIEQNLQPGFLINCVFIKDRVILVLSFRLRIAHRNCYCFHATVMRIIKLKIFPVPVRLHSGYGKLIIVIISPFFAISKNVVHS